MPKLMSYSLDIYVTETIGIKTLSDLVKEKFRIETIFIDALTGL